MLDQHNKTVDGVIESDSELEANTKILEWRARNGKDPLTGELIGGISLSSLPVSESELKVPWITPPRNEGHGQTESHTAPSAPRRPRSRTKSPLRVISSIGNIFVRFAVLAILSTVIVAFALHDHPRVQLARAYVAYWIIDRGFDIAFAGESLSPFSNYEKYVPMKAKLDFSPREIQEKALQIIPKKGKPSDQKIALWGAAAWKCITTKTYCLESAGSTNFQMRDMRLLGFFFLEYSQRQGSPYAAADIGLFLLSWDAPGGRDIFAVSKANYWWTMGLERNPNDERLKKLLLTLNESPWLKYSNLAANWLHP